jgi:hypothetical protein
MNEFPRARDGSWMTGISYEDYLAWLQKYLREPNIAITGEQKAIRDYLSSNYDFSAGYMGWMAGFYENAGGLRPFYSYPNDFEKDCDIDDLKGIVYDDPYEDFLKSFDDDDDEESPSRLEFVLEDYGWELIKRQDALQFEKCLPDFIKLEPLHWMFGHCSPMIEYPDFGWRIYLSFILMRYEDREKRISELDAFFDEYRDAIHK